MWIYLLIFLVTGTSCNPVTPGPPGEGDGTVGEPPTIVPDSSCYHGDGKDYRGKVAKTISGRTCQSWSAQTPHNHTRTPERYPDKGLEENYCRNPIGMEMPWCFTTDSETRWEFCSVLRCEGTVGEPPTIVPDSSCYHGDSKDYRGTVAKTISGRTCQSWSAQTPHNHTRTPERYPDKGLEENYCRNPIGMEMPWCFTTDSETRWEFCSVLRCEGTVGEPPTIVPDSSCYTGKGSDYRGKVAKTESGTTCQSWSVQTPHTHRWTPERYPDKGLEENYCRNPDGEMMPWCYTTDPEKGCEFCSVPRCEGNSDHTC